MACWITFSCDVHGSYANHSHNAPASRYVIGMMGLLIINGNFCVMSGATALLAAVNLQVRLLGWYYLPVVLLSSTLILVVALILNNIQRRYPVFWFSPTVSVPGCSPAPAAPAPVDTESGRPNVNSAKSSVAASASEKQASPTGGIP